MSKLNINKVNAIPNQPYKPNEIYVVKDYNVVTDTIRTNTYLTTKDSLQLHIVELYSDETNLMGPKIIQLPTIEIIDPYDPYADPYSDPYDPYNTPVEFYQDYKITNYDSFITYTVSATNGRAEIIITFNNGEIDKTLLRYWPLEAGPGSFTINGKLHNVLIKPAGIAPIITEPSFDANNSGYFTIGIDNIDFIVSFPSLPSELYSTNDVYKISIYLDSDLENLHSSIAGTGYNGDNTVTVRYQSSVNLEPLPYGTTIYCIVEFFPENTIDPIYNIVPSIKYRYDTEYNPYV